MKPKVSVVLSVYNCEDYVEDAVKSILTQSLGDFELIVVNDGSTDGSKVILERIKDPRMRLIHQTNQGLAKSLNKAISLAKAPYIARMDADDIAEKSRLKVQYTFMERHKDIVLCGTFATLLDEKGCRKRSRSRLIMDLQSMPVMYERIRAIALRYNPFIHPTLMFRKEIFKDVGGYDESFPVAQDYDLVLRILSRYKAQNIPQSLLRFRRSFDSVSFKKMKQQEYWALKARFNALRAGYSLFEAWKLIKPALSFLVPARIKIWLLKRIEYV